MKARRRKSTLEEVHKFVTFVLGRMKLSPEHRKDKNKDIEKNIKVKTPRDLRPEDTTVRSERATVQVCCDSNVACKWIHGAFSLGTKYRRKIGKVQKTHHSGWTENVVKPISNTDGFVKRVYREHNQDFDHWANIGAQEQRKIVLDKRDNSETWKAVRGFWDGSFKNNGNNGCGVVIKGADKEKG